MKAGTLCPPVALASSGIANYTIGTMYEHQDIWTVVDRLRGDLETDEFGSLYVTGVRRAIGGTAKRIRWVIDNPQITSPYVDTVAIEKALAFDWAVIERLTLRETVVFARKLYLEGIDFESWAYARTGKSAPQSARAEAYYASRPAQRNYVQRLLERHGASPVALAALEGEAHVAALRAS